MFIRGARALESCQRLRFPQLVHAHARRPDLPGRGQALVERQAESGAQEGAGARHGAGQG
jgi:hypothetical protein